MNKKEYQNVIDNIVVPEDKLMYLQDSIIEKKFMKSYYKPIFVIVLTTIIILATLTINPINDDSNNNHNFVISVYANNQEKQLKENQSVELSLDTNNLSTSAIGIGEYYPYYCIRSTIPLYEIQWKGDNIDKIIYNAQAKENDIIFFSERMILSEYKEDIVIDPTENNLLYHFFPRAFSGLTDEEKNIAKKMMNNNQLDSESYSNLRVKLRDKIFNILDNGGLKYKKEDWRRFIWYERDLNNSISIAYDKQGSQRYFYYLKIYIPYDADQCQKLSEKQWGEIILKHLQSYQLNVDIQFKDGTIQKKKMVFKGQLNSEGFPYYNIMIQ